jgi:ubiquinone/menaquinone biosynthesis C-methylase UbiE
MPTSIIDSPDDIEIRPRFMRKLAMYLFCKPFIKGKKVIDIACEEGYWAASLVDEANEIVGIDNRPKAIEKAKKKYTSTKLSFKVMDINQLLLDDSIFDVSISIGVIEYLKDYRKHIEEAHRIIKANGLFILGALNSNLSFGTDPFHFQEFNSSELKELLEEYFSTVTIYGLRGKSDTVVKYWDRRRAKVKKLLRWDFLGLHKWMPRSIYSKVFTNIQKRYRHALYVEQEKEISKIKPNDFIIEKENLESAWIFICLAQK